jgi:hypothetical protein
LTDETKAGGKSVNEDLLIGIISLGIAAGLIFFGLPSDLHWLLLAGPTHA